MSIRTGNRLLDTLSPDLTAFILSASRHIDLPARKLLYKGGVPQKHVYLLANGLASVTISSTDGTSVEVGMTGSEGIVGFGSLLGPATTVSDCCMEIAGAGWSLPVEVAQRLFRDNLEFRTQVLALLQSQMAISSQNAACNKLHEAEPRLARWLLTAADRYGSETLQHLTQESLGHKLGTQRTTVVLAEGHLQQMGLVRHTRGKVRIVDRQGLERVACSCYQVTKAVLAGFPSPEIEMEPIPLNVVAGTVPRNGFGRAA